MKDTAESGPDMKVNTLSSETVSNNENRADGIEHGAEPKDNSLSAEPDKKEHQSAKPVKEVGGPKGLEPTRYGDWESKGRCYDF